VDFSLSEDEQTLVALAEQIIGDNAHHATLKAREQAGDRVDFTLWATLAEAGVFSALMPEDFGGSGLGAVALGGICEAVGRHAAALPIGATMAAAQTVAAFSPASSPSRAEAESLIERIIRGTERLAPILSSDLTVSTNEPHGYLNGTASFVADGLDATTLLVAVMTDGAEFRMALIDAEADGVHRTPQPSTTGYDDAVVTFDNVSVGLGDLLGTDDGSDVANFLFQRLDAALCSHTAGLCQGALELGRGYALQRVQFERVIASFQAVSQRVADAWIDLQGIELTSRSAAWRLDAGLDAQREVAIARWWAADAGNRIVHAMVHVHGGVGVDRDYPLHRHFLMARKLELTRGNAEEQLELIGHLIAAE